MALEHFYVNKQLSSKTGIKFAKITNTIRSLLLIRSCDKLPITVAGLYMCLGASHPLYTLQFFFRMSEQTDVWRRLHHAARIAQQPRSCFVLALICYQILRILFKHLSCSHYVRGLAAQWCVFDLQFLWWTWNFTEWEWIGCLLLFQTSKKAHSQRTWDNKDSKRSLNYSTVRYIKPRKAWLKLSSIESLKKFLWFPLANIST